jgi:hypothetical protein
MNPLPTRRLTQNGPNDGVQAISKEIPMDGRLLEKGALPSPGVVPEWAD